MNTAISQFNNKDDISSKWVGWLLAFLWSATLASAMAVVYVTHESRIKLGVLENLRQEQSRLQVAWGQYLLEESTWSAYGRVEKLAQEDLHMAIPSTAKIVMVNPDEG